MVLKEEDRLNLKILVLETKLAHQTFLSNQKEHDDFCALLQSKYELPVGSKFNYATGEILVPEEVKEKEV